MSPVYKSPPLVEALCEFQFEPDQAWDWTLPGLLWMDLGPDAYPHKEQQNTLQLRMHLGGQPADQPVGETREGPARMRFANAARTRLVQVGPDLLAVNCLQEYPGWEQFREWTLEVLGRYVALSPPKAVRRIGLRYINHIRVPQHQVRIEDYLQAVPTVPEPVPQVFSPFMMRVEIPYEAARASMVLRSASIPPGDFDGVVFLLDLDCMTLKGRLTDLSDCRGWIEGAHEVVETTFETCLGPKSRALFEEVQ
jgi:uncharacterized protein (TIGR04255 family)